MTHGAAERIDGLVLVTHEGHIALRAGEQADHRELLGVRILRLEPVGNYAAVPDMAKWLLSIGMLIGRLEIMTVLVLLSPEFWRK